jgi:capsular exopolysaccharide synthesis family protein
MQVVDYAKIPSRPYKPNVRLNLLIALAIGIMGGIGLAFFFEYFDKTVKRVDEISERFQIPVLGVTPQIQEKNMNFDKLVSQDPTSHFSEAIRTTKVSLELSGSGDYPLKSLLITSTAPQEGKTTVASNLAITFAETGERVLLIDCDLRRPRLHRTYGGDQHPRKGLSQFLAGTCGIEEVIKKTDIPNLYFISAGLIPPNPVELLASKRMKKALTSFTEHFDRVILDGPPSGGFADVLVLGNIVSGTILVCSLGQTHRDALRLFLKGILHVNGYLLGCVINKLSSSFRYGYNYGYSYGYSYNYKSKRAAEESKVLLFEEAQQRQSNTAA